MSQKRAKKMRKQEKMELMNPSADQLKQAGEELLEHMKDLYIAIHALMEKNQNEPTGDLTLTVTEKQGAALLAILVDQVFSVTFSGKGGNPIALTKDLNGRSALFVSAGYDMHEYLNAKKQ